MKTEQRDYERVAKAILYLDENFQRQPELDDIAAHVGLSPYHFQRLFKRWAGVSPKRFLQFATVEYAKSLMAEPLPLLEAAMESGLSGPGRLHDLFVQTTAVTPGEYRKRGEGLTLTYGICASGFGDFLAAFTKRGLCLLIFPDDGHEAAVAEMKSRWPRAEFNRSDSDVARRTRDVFHRDGPRGVDLDLSGTNFQLQVWQALLTIPLGEAVSYETVAHRAGRPNAVRAAAQAVGANPVSFLIPCHRVIRSTGAYGGYRWGLTRKRTMLAWEASITLPAPAIAP